MVLVYLARIFSLIFHPLLLATYMFSLFAFVFPIAFDPIKEDGTWRFIFLLFCVTFVLPVLMISLLKTLGVTSSFTMYTRKERVLPFTMITVFYTAVTYVFYNRAEVSLNDNFLKFLIIINALVVVCSIVTIFYKVSVHSLGIWGVIGILLSLNQVSETPVLFYPLITTILLAGVVMSSRLKLHVHSLGEVVVGSIVGFATSASLMAYLFRY
jgi:membrane-associated phospholipid phosphatase